MQFENQDSVALNSNLRATIYKHVSKWQDVLGGDLVAVLTDVLINVMEDLTEELEDLDSSDEWENQK